MLRAALRRRSFDEATMVAVPCALAAFWWSEARPSAERRAAQQAPECAYRPSEELIGADVASRLDRGQEEVRLGHGGNNNTAPGLRPRHTSPSSSPTPPKHFASLA